MSQSRAPDSESGEIQARYAELGGPEGRLGSPLGAEEPFFGGLSQIFQNGTIYWRYGAGAHALFGLIRDKYEELHSRRDAAIGFPIAEEQVGRDGSRFNAFEHGYIFLSPDGTPRSVEFSPSVESLVTYLGTDPTDAAEIVRNLLKDHSDYGDNAAAETAPKVQDTGVTKSAREWAQQAAEMLKPTATELHGRVLILALCRLVPGLAAQLTSLGFLQRLEAELTESIDALLRPGTSLKLLRAGYLSDAVRGDDLDCLDIMPDVQALAAVMASRDVSPPLSVGLFGDWGTGKSFFMDKLRQEVERLAPPTNETNDAVAAGPGTKPEGSATEPGLESNADAGPFCRDILQIEFNAWHYLDANLWASLVAEVFERLMERVHKDDPGTKKQQFIHDLSNAQGLVARSQVDAQGALRKREQAEVNLASRRDELATQESHLIERMRVVTDTVLSDPALQKQLEELGEKYNVKQLGAALTDLDEEGRELAKARHTAAKVIETTQRDDLIMVLVGVVVALLLAVGLTFFISRSGAEQSVATWIGSLTGVVVGAGAIFRQIRGILARITNALNEARDAKARRIAEQLSTERQAVELAKSAEQTARERLEAANQQEIAARQALQGLDPAHQFRRLIEERSASREYAAQLGLVSLIRRDFSALSELLARKRLPPSKEDQAAGIQPASYPVERIILYVDDLDRCKPDKVVAVLEAVHLLLAFELFVVVVAVDPRWLRRCLMTHYSALLSAEADADKDANETEVRVSTPQDYLEKIFQIPFCLDPITEQGYRALIRTATGKDVEVVAPRGSADGRITPDTPPPGNPPPLPAHLPVEQRRAEPPPPAPLDSEQLQFKSWEAKTMEHFWPLFRTPRMVKRFVNTYRLIRVRVPSESLSTFEGSADVPGDYLAAMLLLAVICGYPNVAPEFLRRLREAANERKTWGEFVEALALDTDAADANAVPVAPNGHPEQTINDEAHLEPATENGEWAELRKALRRLEAAALLPDISHYGQWIERTARYSFSASLASSLTAAGRT
jgi:KAP family P-loop domain/LGFP repeat